MKKSPFTKLSTVASILLFIMLGFVITAFTNSNTPQIAETFLSPVNKAPLKSELNWLDFESGYAKAVKENKMLLIDVYTDWCGWCKVMDRTTYSNDTVIDLINASYVAVKLNPEKNRSYTFGKNTMTATELHKWLGYGQTFGYPTTYFMVQPGKTEERYAQVGYLETAEFAGILEQVKAKKPE